MEDLGKCLNCPKECLKCEKSKIGIKYLDCIQCKKGYKLILG
jgi:hypothetical protein